MTDPITITIQQGTRTYSATVSPEGQPSWWRIAATDKGVAVCDTTMPYFAVSPSAWHFMAMVGLAVDFETNEFHKAGRDKRNVQMQMAKA